MLCVSNLFCFLLVTLIFLTIYEYVGPKIRHPYTNMQLRGSYLSLKVGKVLILWQVILA